MSDQIITFKILGSDEIIGTVKEETDDYYILSNVRVLMLQPVNKNQVTVIPVPFMVSNADADMKFYKKNILAVPTSAVPNELEKMYLADKTGIDLATSAPVPVADDQVKDFKL